MRATTAGEDTVLGSASYGTHLRVRVADADGTLQDLSDRCLSGRISQTVDQMVPVADVVFQRGGTGSQSLAPLDEDSTLNRDALSAYAPLIDAGRLIVIDFATVALGSSPGASDWQKVFQGIIDTWSLDSEEVSVQCRDEVGRLIGDRWIETEGTLGSSEGVALSTVMQEILDQWAPGVTLYVPTEPTFLVTDYEQQKMRVLDALVQLAALIGWVVEPRWRESSTAWELTLYEPDRDASVAEWSWSPNRYETVQEFRLSSLNIRNAISIWYGTAEARSQYTTEDSVSIARYGRQWMEFEEADDSPINTLSEAQAMADAALLDLKDPIADQEIRTMCFWPVQLGDYYEFTDNAVHYSENQAFGVTGYRHEWAGGQIDTYIRTRGKPAGFTQAWIVRGGRRRDPVAVANAIRLFNVRTIPDSPAEGQTTLKATRGPAVDTVGVYEALALAQEDIEDPGTWPTSQPWPGNTDQPTFYIAAEEDIEIVYTTPAEGRISYILLEPRDASGKAGERVKVEIHPKAVSTGRDLPDGTVIYEKLAESAQQHGFTGTFSSPSSNGAAWTSGTLTLTNGNSYSISSGSVGGIQGIADPTYIYFDATISTTEFQTTEDFENDVLDSETAMLIATTWAGSVDSSVVQAVGVLGLDGSVIRPLSILTGNLAANSVSAGKISVATLSAITANMGTLTAGTISAGVIIATGSFTAPVATFNAVNVTGDFESTDLARFTTSGSITIEDDREMEFISSSLNTCAIFETSGSTLQVFANWQFTGGSTLGFFGASPVGKPTVTGSRGGNAALADLLTELDTMGLITNSSSA